MEGDAGTRQLNPTDADETPDESLAVSEEDQTEQATEPESPEPADEGVGDGRRPSRLGVGWVVGVCAGLLVLGHCVLDQTPDWVSPRAIRTRSAIQAFTSDSSQPTARTPSSTGRGNVPPLMFK